MIDQVEVGRRVAPRLRVAFEVADADTVTRELVDGGADLVAEPTGHPVAAHSTPASKAPAGLQLTVFQELGTTHHETT